MPSPKLNIPRDQIPVLITLGDLSESVFKDVLSAVQNAEPALTQKQYIEKIQEKVKHSDIENIILTIFALYWLKERDSLSTQEVVDAIGASLSKSNLKDVGAERINSITVRLRALLEADKSLSITSKAFDVMTEHPNIFCGARILSDIRPVFTKAADSASGAVIIHNLQIGFHNLGDHREFYVALDANDIQVLKDVILRAETKAKSLEAILNKAGVPYLRV